MCPHRCGADRENKIFGSCGVGINPIVARAYLHQWEEPVISGTRGSGTVFFSGCNLHCVFCQNYDISSKNFGKEISIKRLREIYLELIRQGAHNINLVTPTHFTESILQSLAESLAVPVVWNSSGFESVDTLKRLEGKVQIYLPDLKYFDDVAAVKYSNAYNYFQIATTAIKEMYRQVGDYVLDGDGVMQKGVIIRHLLLPNRLDDTKKIIDWVANNFKPGQVMFSLMHQYVPCGRAKDFAELNRKVTQDEYEEAELYLMESKIEDGFVQEGEAASGEFIPKWDLTGV